MGALRQTAHRRHPIRVEEDVGALRREVAAMAARLPRRRDGDAELVATELASNIVRHTATGGHILYRRVGDGIEFLATDRGPGSRSSGTPSWAAPERREQVDPPSFRRGGLGVGLAGVQRLATTFDCYSALGGTVVLVRLGTTAPAANGRWSWGAVNVPLDGFSDSGDAWAVAAQRGLAALVVDGLGHGPAAAVAARAAVSAFEQSPVTDLDGFICQAHEAMRTTRGGVLGVCVIDGERDELRFAGVGNVTGRVLLGGESHSLLGHDGTLGTQWQPPRTRLTVSPWGPDATLVLVSDGIRSHWDPRSYPRLLLHDPAVIAAVLQRDHGRGADDATVLVVQDTRGHHMRGGDPQGGER